MTARGSVGSLAMLANCIEDFHQWRTAAAGRGAPSIVLSAAPRFAGGLSEQIGRYLNEYDESAEGHWTAFSDSLLMEISLSPVEKALLGVPNGCVACPAGSVCSQRKVHKAIADLGYSILEGPLAVEGCRGLTEVFRVGVGMSFGDPDGADLAIQPDRFPVRCLPVLIGDTYMEWQATRHAMDGH